MMKTKNIHKISATNMIDSFYSNSKKQYFLPLFMPNAIEVKEVCYRWYQSQVETLGPIGLKMLPHVSFQLTIEFCSVIKKISKFGLFVQSRYLKLYPIQMFIYLVVVQEKEEPLLRSQKMVIVFPLLR